MATYESRLSSKRSPAITIIKHSATIKYEGYTSNAYSYIVIPCLCLHGLHNYLSLWRITLQITHLYHACHVSIDKFFHAIFLFKNILARFRCPKQQGKAQNLLLTRLPRTK